MEVIITLTKTQNVLLLRVYLDIFIDVEHQTKWIKTFCKTLYKYFLINLMPQIKQKVGECKILILI